MSTKTFSNVRTKQKHDIESNWLKATGFTPLDGELIVYDVDETHSKPRLKIGDGEQNVNLLPFISSDIELKSGTNVEINKNEDDSYTISATYTYTLPQATEENLGGVKIGYAQEGKNYPIVLDTNGKAYVNVPWTDTNTHQNAFSQVTIIDNSNSSTIEADTSTDTLTIQVGSGLNATTNIAGDEFILSAEVTKSYVDEVIANLVDTAPDTLNTLNELAAALGNDENFATTITTQIGEKVDKVEGKGLSANDFTTAYKNKLDNINVGFSKEVQTIVGDGVTTEFNIPHSLNTVDFVINIYDAETYEDILVDTVRSINNVNIKFNEDYPPVVDKEYKIVMVSGSYDGELPDDFKVVTTTDHSQLMNRGAENQHPISAITGLEETLSQNKQDTVALKDEIAVERARINTFTSLEEGSTTGDAELLDGRTAINSVTYDNIGEAVRTQAKSLNDEIKSTMKQTDFITYKSKDNHFYPIYINNLSTIDTWKEITAEDDTIQREVYKTIEGSDFIKCPKYLCLDFSDTTSRCYLYFYKLENGEYIPNWDIPYYKTSAGIINYFGDGAFSTNMIEIDDDSMYMKISIAVGDVDFYGWDGMPTGIPLSSNISIPVTSQNDNEYAFSADGSFGVTVSGNAKYFVCANGAYFSTGIGMKNGIATVINSKARNFLALDEGYDYFNFRVFRDNGECVVGDVSDFAIAITPNSNTYQTTIPSQKVIDNCKKINELKWTALIELPAYVFNTIDEDGNITSTTNGSAYKTGIKYNGLPYCSNWDTAHYIGWHTSPHTFINAANDVDSIFYKERVPNWNNTLESLYYGSVCSAFGTMVQGWSYPQTNAGFIYDPAIDVKEEKTPTIGSLYSNLTDHCLIPERIDTFENMSAIIAYEGIRPLTSRTTRYSNINIDTDNSGFNSFYGDGYYDDYGYSVSYKEATGNVPYADFDSAVITGGSARPYKGDKCVYTSEEDVLINIKNNATSLILTKDETSQTIDVTGLTQIDVKDYLSGDGIYYVGTNVDEITESFEYHTVEPIMYDIKDGKILFSSNDFWYAACNLIGFSLFTDEDGNLQAKVCCVPSNADNNYSDWLKEGYFTSADAVFRKGEYGAYVVPLVKGTVEETNASMSDNERIKMLEEKVEMLLSRLSELQ